jgi:hypothetical protein
LIIFLTAIKIKLVTKPETGSSKKGQPFKLARPQKQSYIQYYGYEVSSEWLVQFAEHYCAEGLPHRNAIDYEHTAVTLAHETIQDWCITSLAIKACFKPPKGGPVPPEWLASVYGEGDDPEDLQIVGVFSVCSDDEHDFEWRPPQEEMDFLTKLFGRGPQWWPGCWSED